MKHFLGNQTKSIVLGFLTLISGEVCYTSKSILPGHLLARLLKAKCVRTTKPVVIAGHYGSTQLILWLFKPWRKLLQHFLMKMDCYAACWSCTYCLSSACNSWTRNTLTYNCGTYWNSVETVHSLMSMDLEWFDSCHYRVPLYVYLI